MILVISHTFRESAGQKNEPKVGVYAGVQDKGSN